MTSPSAPPSRLAPYKQVLAALSQRTRTPLPSLIISFAVLHELTAIVPVFGFFFGARALGVGENVVHALVPAPGSEATSSGVASKLRDTWLGAQIREWMAEGEARAERVGRRYGWLGFEKGSKPDPQRPASLLASGKVAGDIANAVVAYALTKVRSAMEV